MEVDATETSVNSSSSAGHANEKELCFLGSPTFVDLGNGRLRCKETGHEFPAKDMDSYVRTKSCRLALIDVALSRNQPPLNNFLPHPLYKSKLVCGLTGDTINKSEEHICKHINGRRFLKKFGTVQCILFGSHSYSSRDSIPRPRPQLPKVLTNKATWHPQKGVQHEDFPGDENEVKKQQSPEKIEKDVKKSIKHSNLNAISLQHKKAKAFMPRELEAESSDSEEPDFWIPTVVGRLDSDDGKVSGECSTNYQEAEANLSSSLVDEERERETLELSIRTKRMSIAVGPSSFASRKKKNKKASSPTFPEALRDE